MKKDAQGSGLRAAVRARWPEWRAALGWIVGSWVRPAGAAARWEQDPKRSRPGTTPWRRDARV